MSPLVIEKSEQLISWHCKLAERARTQAEVHAHIGELEAEAVQRKRQQSHLSAADCIRTLLRAVKSKETEKASRQAFTPPSDADCVLYAEEIGLPRAEAMRFHDHFQSNGWKVSGKAVMKDWKAALRNWHRNWKERQPASKRPTLPPLPTRPQ